MQIRDFAQLREAEPFAVTAVEGLLAVESSLQEALRYIPFCDEHLNVWSHHFAAIILGAASQIDSLWTATTRILEPATANRNLHIGDHRDRFGTSVSRQGVVFFAEGPHLR